MATIPSISAFTVGQKLTAAQCNNLKAAIDFLVAPPLCVLTRSTTAAIANNTSTAIPFDTEAVDSDNMFNVGTSTINMVAVTPGWYSCTAAYTWAANVTGSRVGAFLLNGAEVARNEQQANTASGRGISIAIATELFMNVGDTLSVESFQTSGSALSIGAGARFSAQWTHS